MKKIGFGLFSLFFVLFQSVAFAEERLKLADVVLKFPQTAKLTLKNSFSKEAIPGWALVLGTTAITYHYDEELIDNSTKFGRDIGIGNKDGTKSVLTINGQEILRLPSDTGSLLYFLGDGWMHFGIAASIAGYGYLKDQTYEVNTGIMIAHGMVVSTVFNQALKRSFGRESPEVQTVKRGAWKLFPSVNEYNSKTATYDAMPSGHVMTATLTFTILAERYPEHQTAIYSVGGVWISALMFQMMNNKVHWASDYPLGIAMGYVIGKASTKIVNDAASTKEEKQTSWNYLPMPTGNGMSVLAFKNF